MTEWDKTPVEEPVKPSKEEVAVKAQKAEQKSFKFGKGIRRASDIPVKEFTIMGLYGTYGSGKTHFSLTSKLPIVIVDTERKADDIAKRLPNEVQENIYIFDVLQYADLENGEIDYTGLIDSFRNEIVGFVRELKTFGEVGTIVVDSMSDIVRWYDLWLEDQPGLKRDKETNAVSPFERGKTKSQLRQILDILKATGWNIIVTFKEKQDWADGKPANSFSPEWNKELGYACNFVVNIRKYGDKHQFVLIKNGFGNTTELDIWDVDWRGFHNIISDHGGVKFK